MWIKLHTKLLDWEWASCPETIALWIHILLRANYETKRWQGVEIPRGSLVTSLSKLALETGLSVSQIRTNLELPNNCCYYYVKSQAMNIWYRFMELMCKGL